MSREPLVLRGIVTAAGTSLVSLLVVFGIPLTGDQQSAILGALGAVAALVVAFLARPVVTPVAAPAMPDGSPATLVPELGPAGLDHLMP